MQLTQSTRLPSEGQTDAGGHWLVLFGEDWDLAGSELPYAAVLAKAWRRRPNRSPGDPVTVDLPNHRLSRVAMAAVAADISSFELLGLARKLVSAQLEFEPRRLGLAVCGLSAPAAERCAEAVVSAALAARAAMPSLKAERSKPRSLEQLRIFGLRTRHGFKRSFAEAAGNNLARELTILPPNHLTPAKYLRRLRSLAKARQWRLTVFDEKALKRKGAGAFLAVSQGSPTRDACIVRLSYRPPRARRRVALAGKGICYDTGGVNLKPANYMLGMHKDMEGSAVALGVLLALTELQAPIGVDCWLALAMNHIGPEAYKPNDVVTALNGTSIEIIHSDAEGRMVLADTLALASESRPRPDALIDYATLTGSCVGALGKRYSGVFTNRQETIAELIEAGRASGERVWPFPNDKDYDDGLKSSIADVKQCAVEGRADHILAARFLQRFVDPELAWLHMDLSSGSHDGGLAHIPTDITGFGVRYTLSLLLDRAWPPAS